MNFTLIYNIYIIYKLLKIIKLNQIKAARAPMAAVIPPPTVVVISVPVIPREVSVENKEPAATFPIVAWAAAARLPAATPAVPKPNKVAPSPPAAANEPPIIKIEAIINFNMN